jgi:uncharacterized glyoxalase superfamily protein PhnB
MLFAKDLRETIDFYTKTLGFELGGTEPDGDTPTFCQFHSGDAQIMFYSDVAGKDNIRPACTGQIYLYPWDLDEAWAELKDRKEVVSDLREHPWGMRDFRIKDPNGYVLIFGLSADPHHH